MDGKRYNSKTDIWSLGCVLYELLCLRLPFDGNSMRQLCHNIIHASPPQPDRNYSKEIRDLAVTEMLAKNSKMRPGVNAILAKPLMRDKISSFLDDARKQHEFSHTILHGQNILSSAPIVSNASPNIWISDVARQDRAGAAVAKPFPAPTPSPFVPPVRHQAEQVPMGRRPPASPAPAPAPTAAPPTAVVSPAVKVRIGAPSPSPMPSQPVRAPAPAPSPSPYEQRRMQAQAQEAQERARAIAMAVAKQQAQQQQAAVAAAAVAQKDRPMMPVFKPPISKQQPVVVKHAPSAMPKDQVRDREKEKDAVISPRAGDKDRDRDRDKDRDGRPKQYPHVGMGMGVGVGGGQGAGAPSAATPEPKIDRILAIMANRPISYANAKQKPIAPVGGYPTSSPNPSGGGRGVPTPSKDVERHPSSAPSQLQAQAATPTHVQGQGHANPKPRAVPVRSPGAGVGPSGADALILAQAKELLAAQNKEVEDQRK